MVGLHATKNILRVRMPMSACIARRLPSPTGSLKCLSAELRQRVCAGHVPRCVTGLGIGRFGFDRVVKRTRAQRASHVRALGIPTDAAAADAWRMAGPVPLRNATRIPAHGITQPIAAPQDRNSLEARVSAGVCAIEHQGPPSGSTVQQSWKRPADVATAATSLLRGFNQLVQVYFPRVGFRKWRWSHTR